MIEFTEVRESEFDDIYNQMQMNFIEDEIRDYDNAKATMQDKKYNLYHAVSDGNRVGFVGIWNLEGFTFLEHFVVYSQFRNMGIGGKILEELIGRGNKLVLEVEPPENEMASRRIAFYQRNGMSCNDVPYMQPSYREKGNEVELILMSSGGKLEEPERVIKEIYENVYKKCSLVVRDMQITDDFAQVASLIYDTDNYIYPYLFSGDKETGIRVLQEMIRRDTIYNYRNIKVAIQNDTIVGMIVMKRTPIDVDGKKMITAFLEAGEPVGERFTKVYKEYFELLEKEPEGIYIANVCVDECYRGQGIGKKMLSLVLEEEECYHLETVKDNKNAVELYLKSGFVIEYEYGGFTGVPCYRMSRAMKKR